MDHDINSVELVGRLLNDIHCPLKDRFRALFTLRNIGGRKAIGSISQCFADESALLKHELAYCLGQMQDEFAVPTLVEVLCDKCQETIVRHEAGEALGAIGSLTSLPVLKEHCDDAVIEVAETCQLAVSRIQWLHDVDKNEAALPTNPYKSVDPAPPIADSNISRLGATLMDESLPLFQRYRALFSLRNIGTKGAVLLLAEGLKCKSALMRHEIAYVLGQTQHPAGIKQLSTNLHDTSEHGMVRHECAEALGSIATKECTDILQNYLNDSERVVRESCEVALDISESTSSNEFQYANGLSQLSSSGISSSGIPFKQMKEHQLII